VMCSDSDFTHLASGANPLTPSRNRAIFLRIVSSKSIPMNIRIGLQQRPPDHIQRLLRGKLPNARSVSGEIAFDYLRSFVPR